MKKLYFHLLDLTVLNSYILYKSCGGNMTHLKFRERLDKDLVLSHEESTEIVVCQGVGSAVLGSNETTWSKTFSALARQRKRETACVKNEKKKRTKQKAVYYCKKCDCGLCGMPCFMLWHNKNPAMTRTDCTCIRYCIVCVTWSTVMKQTLSCHLV
jgi:hypothetical protein